MRNIFIILMSLMAFTACDAYLNVQPKGYTIPSKYEDYRQLMNYAQLYKNGDITPVYMTDDVLFADGDIENNLDAQDDNVKYLYKFNHGPIFNDGDSDAIWEYGYNRIYTLNVVINNVLNTPDGSKEEKEATWAEAKVARAYEYLTLVTIYAPAYDKNTASKDLGVPIISTEDIGKMDYVRNTVQQVYDFIETDLREALPKLKDKPDHRFAAGKNVAYSFMAKLQMLKGNYEECMKNAVEALKLSKELVDLTKYAIKSPTQYIGRIVLAEDMITPYPDAQDNPEVILARYCPYVFAGNISFYASEELLQIFEKDVPAGATDYRRKLFYSDDQFAGMEFPGYTTWCPYVRMNYGLNNMDVILMAAEGYARIGDSKSLEQAAYWYNYLRDHRIENNVHVAFASADEALVKVLEERRREFAMVGNYRFVDLKRLNKESRFAKTVVHTCGSEKWELPANDNRWIFPIPPNVKAFRPDIPDYER